VFPAFVDATTSALPADVLPTAQQSSADEQDTPVSGPASCGSDPATQSLPPFVVVIVKPKKGDANPTATQVDVVGQERSARR
jgi:hypothetical protein